MASNPYTQFSPYSGGGGASEFGYGTTPGTLSTATAQSNLAAAPYHVQLANVINAANRAAQQQANVARIPGAAGLEELSSRNIQEELSGQLSQSYLDQLYGNLAQSWGGRGFGVDTGALNAAALRAIGLTTEELRKQGQLDLTAAYDRNPAAKLFDISPYLTTPSVYSSAANERARLAEEAREFDAKLALEYASLAAKGAAGGGAPRITGGLPTYTGTQGGYVPSTLYALSNDMVTRSTPSMPEEFDQYMTGSGEVTPLDWGYAPTSSGTMYMGSLEGYDPGLDAWLGESGYSPTGTEL